MSATVKNNLSAMKTLNTLNKNTGKLSKQLKKVSSGLRINNAGDDAAGYAISERMRVRIRGLEQDERNVQTGISLLKVAEGGIQQVIDEIRSLRELSINAANDHNSDADRAIMQKEFDQRRAHIDEIASETNYNGKLLLDGRYGLKNLTMTEEPVEPTGSPAIISGTGARDALATYTISTDGVYQLDASCAFCRIVVDAANVEIVGSGAQNTNIYIECQQADTNLWLKDVDIYHNRCDSVFGRDEGDDISFIRFGTGTANTLNITGTNRIENWSRNGRPEISSAVINIGGGLTVYGDGELKQTVQRGWDSGAFLGTDKLENSNADLIINSGTIICGSEDGAGIGSGLEGSIGNITINGGTIRSDTASSAAIGSGYAGATGNITINGGDVQAYAWQMGFPGIGASYDGSAGDITFNGGKIHASSLYYAGGEAVGAGINASVGSIQIPEAIYISGNKSLYDQDLPDVPVSESWEGNPLVIHHGTKANEALNVYINDMHVKSLKSGGKSLADASVVTRTKAVDTISILDGALNYALNEITNIGAYISRLEHTDTNIVTANESTQASESTLRDADMAKEMTEYTKASVLSQAAQSMLAQANQNSSSVLSLLQ